MTKKRFTDIWCSETGDIGFTYDGVALTFKGDSLETFLNELVEENEQLRHDATVLIQSNQEYRKENEELKKELSELKKECIKKAKEEIRKQREENAIRWANIGR